MSATKSKPVKVGQKVSFARRTGERLVGKVQSVEDRGNGSWATVAVPTDKRGVNKTFMVRLSQLTAV